MQVGVSPRHHERTLSERMDEPTAVLPNVCPECDGHGYLDYINLVRETKTQICQSCGLRWESPID